MNLEEFGFNEKVKHVIPKESMDDIELGRVVSEHKERYVVQTQKGSFNAEITGNLRFTAESRADFPTVGDWLKVSVFDELAIILEVLPRFSLLERQAVGKFGETQPIASNVDVAFVMQAVGHDFNLNRLERYLIVCNTASIQPVIVLSKIDLISSEELSELLSNLDKRLPSIPVIPISNQSLAGYDVLKSHLEPGKTYCILGSSGVGKSSLVNNVLQSQKMAVSTISESTNKGRHTTSHRELFILPEGGVIIDTPGMRELGIATEGDGIDQTFSQITELAEQCRFGDCSHTEELGCAVLKALESGVLDQGVFHNYHKLKREQEHFSSTVYERRAKDKKLGKLYKSIMKNKTDNKR